MTQKGKNNGKKGGSRGAVWFRAREMSAAAGPKLGLSRKEEDTATRSLRRPTGVKVRQNLDSQRRRTGGV